MKFDYFTASNGTVRVDVEGELQLDTDIWTLHGRMSINELPEMAFPFPVIQNGKIYKITARTEKAVKVKSEDDGICFFVPQSALFKGRRLNIAKFHRKASIARDKWANQKMGLK